MKSFWTEFLEESKNILLLQGPIGPFFTHFQNYLVDQKNKTVFKLNFNGGDEYYSPVSDTTFNYSGSINEFVNYLDTFVIEHQIDAIVCFGDGRIYHKQAKEYCKQHENMTFWAFEEGYLRPHYITFEKWGVNYNSTLCRDKDRYDKELYCDVVRNNQPEKELVPVAASFFTRAKIAVKYYFEMRWKQKYFPQYIHHREARLRIYAGAWLKAGFSKCFYKYKDRETVNQIRNKTFGEFFVFPLQVHNDNQIVRHGKGLSMSAYIRKVIYSFALYAPKNCKLVIKHHPMDRGFSNYHSLISKLSARRGVENRVVYLHEIPMPDLLRNAKGMVVINSTSGISALIHGMPIKVIGNAHYDIQGLSSSLSLKDFWANCTAPRKKCVKNYLSLLQNKTQLNGTFYHLDQLSVLEFQ